MTETKKNKGLKTMGIEKLMTQEDLEERRHSADVKEELTTLADAFALGDDDDQERVVRAVALLLDWMGENGSSEDMRGGIPLGLGRILYKIADRMALDKRHAALEEAYRQTTQKEDRSAA